MRVSREEFNRLVERAIQQEKDDPTSIEEVEAWEREMGLAPIVTDDDFARSMGAMFLMVNLNVSQLGKLNAYLARMK